MRREGKVRRSETGGGEEVKEREGEQGEKRRNSERISTLIL